SLCLLILKAPARPGLTFTLYASAGTEPGGKCGVGHALNVLPEKRGLSPSNAKGPVSDDGAFRTFLRWQGMLSDPANFSIRHALIWFQGPPLLALRARCWAPARASHRRKLWHQIRPSKLTKWAAAAAPHTWAGLQLVEVKLTARVRANP